MSSPLRDALSRGLSSGGDLAAEIHELGDVALADPGEAEALCEAIDRMPPEPPTESTTTRSPLHAVLGLLQAVETRAAYDVIVDRGIPRLLTVIDELVASGSADARRGLVLFAMKVLGLYQVPEAVGRIATLARRPGWDGDDLWEVVFRVFNESHPYRLDLCDRLRDPLPTGFAGIAYLDFANALGRDGALDAGHPFDTPEGKNRLLGFLRDPDLSRFSHAHSAAAALPFISVPDREQLLALAMDHPAESVQMEGAWSAARLGSEAGIKFLSRACLNAHQSLKARLYLQELNRHDAVPDRARDPNFEAMAKLVDWLSHPMEFGRPPDAIQLLDTRELLWPPANELRRLWIFRYRYTSPEPSRSDDHLGVGLVGSITFSLFNETSPEMSPEDIYALHCCWELQVDDDPRAPDDRTIAAGRRLLGFPS